MPLTAQNSNSDLLRSFHMNEALDPPQGILSTKSIVLFDVPKGVSDEERLRIADELQGFFAEEGIDAVVYFEVNKFLSVSGMQEQIPNGLLRRDIENLIFLSVLNIENDFVIGIGPFNGKNSFYDKGATFWLRRTSDLQAVFSELNTRFKTGAFPKTNLLVNSKAEFFEPSVAGFRQAYATLPKDFSKKKIILPTVNNQPFDEPGPLAVSREAVVSPNQFEQELLKRQNALNALVKLDSTLFQVMNVENKTDEDLRRARADYVLHYIEAPARNVYSFLPFEKREEKAQGTLVKFFLRDTRSNNAYLGSEWDAKSNWQEAFQSFIAQIEKIRSQQPD